MTRSRLLPLAIALVLASVAGCGGPQSGSGEGTLEPAPELPSLMGELEEQARAWLEDMALILVANLEAPDQAVSRMGTFLRVHQEEMFANARAIEARYRALEGSERRRYEAESSDYFGDAWAAWDAALHLFMESHTQEGGEIQDMVEQFDDDP